MAFLVKYVFAGDTNVREHFTELRSRPAIASEIKELGDLCRHIRILHVEGEKQKTPLSWKFFEKSLKFPKTPLNLLIKNLCLWIPTRN